MFFDLLFGGNRHSSRRVTDYHLDYALKSKLGLMFFVIPSLRCFVALSMGLLLFLDILANPSPSKLTIDMTSVADFLWMKPSPVDYRVVGIFLHLTLIFPFSAINMRAGHKLNKMSKWNMPVSILERHFLYVAMWATYTVIGVILVFLFSTTNPVIIVSLIPELALDIFGFFFTARSMRSVNEIREVAVAAGRPAPVFSLDSDFCFVLCQNTLSFPCQSEVEDDVRA